MKTTKTKYPYVYRAVYPKEYVDGYLAKVVRRTTRLHKVIQLSEHDGDHEKCLEAAAKLAADFAKRNPPISRQEMAELPRKKKDDDLPVGVRRVDNQVKGRIYKSYEAEWSPTPNRQKKRRFSVNKYGEEEAFLLALESRRVGLAEMDAY